MACCQWCIIESQMAWFRGYSFWICSGNEVKEDARQWLEFSSLPLPEQILKASIPSHQSDSCPNLSGIVDSAQLLPPMSSQASSYPVMQRPGRLNSLVWPVLGLRPQGLGKCGGHEFKDLIDKGCVFHQLVCHNLLYFLGESLSFKKKKKLFSLKFI